MEYPSDVEIVQALRKRIKELEDGACRFNCRTVKEHEKEIDRLKSELMTAYDLVAEAIADKQSYDFNARAQAFVDKHTVAERAYQEWKDG